MSENNNRLTEPEAEGRQPTADIPQPGYSEDLLAQVEAENLDFPTDLVENMLSDLEDGLSAVSAQPPAAAEERASQTTDAESDSTPDGQLVETDRAQEDTADDSEVNAVPEPQAPAAVSSEYAADISEEPEGVPATEIDADKEAVDEMPEDPVPVITEAALTVAEKVTDETAGMTLVERAQYHARMRRREQTRVRRENARRAATGEKVPYQPMTPLDMRFTLIRLSVAVVFLVVGLVFGKSSIAFAMYLLAYLLTGVPIAARVAQNFAHGKYFDEYLLILIASLGAFLLGNRPEASIILILHGVGKMVSDLVLSSTHQSLARQTGFLPDKASLVNMQGEERQVSPSDIRIGEFVLVRSGERIPIDGIVLRGEGTVDDTVLTGDAEPSPIGKNDKVLAGSLYTGSLLLMRATTRFTDCAVSQILRVQDEGSECRAALEKSVLTGAARVIPVAVVLAVLLAVIPPLFNSATTMANWIYRALTILMICCPTALMISVPLCFMCGRGRLSQKGIHVKGSAAVEKMAELRMAVFDKTGTLTEGNLRVKEIQTTQDFNQESILALAAAAEQLSPHPVARALVAAYPSVPQKISEFEEFPGRGVRARIGNRNLLAGNRRLMVSRGVKGVPEIAGTVVYIAYDGDYAGAIVLEDTIRTEAKDAIHGMKSQGVLRTVILTGDTEIPAQRTADAIGIDTIHYGLQPEEKASKMEFLLRTIPTDGTAAYIGDGVNDLEELKLADVGVAMGVAGSSRSADAANVLIMSNDLTRLADAMRICRRTHSIAFQNMVFVLLVKILLVLLTVVGVAYMWQAVAADVLMTVLTVLNSARILGLK